ncbi:MAG: hypothetical protein AABX77_02970 [Nanoarchaeota archaeon]
MPIDISGVYFFMPIFSFLFVFLIVYAILARTKILGEAGFMNLLVSFIMAIIFMSFSSLELYVKTIVPWAIVLLVSVFLVLLLAGMSTKELDKIMTKKFAWSIIIILIVIFLISAIKVFNPVFHPDLIITSGEGTSLIEQLTYSVDGRVAGTILLILIAIVVSWILTRK